MRILSPKRVYSCWSKWAVLALLVFCLLFWTQCEAVADGKITSKALTEKDFLEFVNKLKNSAKERFKPPEGPFDEEEARKARYRLADEQKRIQELEAKAAEAMKLWNSLSDEQKAKVLQQAAQRAKEKEQQIKKDIELSEKLLQKEAADLENEIDEKVKRQEEEEARLERERLEREQAEFEARRLAHRARKMQERPTSKSAIFWAFTFALSFSLARIAFRPKQRKTQSL